MKYFISRSLPVVFLLMLALISGCKPQYTIETVIAYEQPATVSVADKQLTETRIRERLSDRFGDDFSVEPLAGGFRILTPHYNQPIAEIAGLIGYFGSAEMGLYDVFPVDDPSVRAVLDSFAWPDYITLPEQSNPYRRHLVGSTINTARTEQLQRELNALVPEGLPLTFMWSQPQDPLAGQGGSRFYELYALRTKDDTGAPRIDNRGVATAKVQSTQQGEIAVSLEMTPEATTEWAEMTSAAAGDNSRPIAIVVNGEVVSSPSVQSAITGGMTMITGGFSVEEATALADQLQWESLPVSLKIVSQEVVE